MKTFSAEARAAIAAGDVMTSGAVRIGLPTPACFWGGHGNLVLDGEVYSGVGDKGLVAVSGGALGSAEQGAELALSGVDPEVLARIDFEALRGCSVVLSRLIFNGTGARLLHAAVFLRGSIDRAPITETAGGTSTIKLNIEGAVRGLGRRSERMRSDADQRLISETDGGFRRVTYAGEKQVSWGGKPPQRAGGAFGGMSAAQRTMVWLATGVKV